MYELYQSEKDTEVKLGRANLLEDLQYLLI